MVTFQATITSPRCRSPAGGGIGLVEDLEHLERDAEVGIGVVVDVRPGDVGLALLPVEPIDVVLDALVDVDRLLVDEERRREEVDLAEDAVPVAGRVDDHDVLRRAGAQAEVAGREVLVAPVVAVVVGAPDPAVLLEDVEQGRRLVDPEALGRRAPGSSKLEARRWLRRTWRLSGLTRPCSGELSKRYSGWAARNWSIGADEQTSADRLVPAAAAGTAHLLPGRWRSCRGSRC